MDFCGCEHTILGPTAPHCVGKGSVGRKLPNVSVLPSIGNIIILFLFGSAVVVLIDVEDKGATELKYNIGITTGQGLFIRK